MSEKPFKFACNDEVYFVDDGIIKRGIVIAIEFHESRPRDLSLKEAPIHRVIKYEVKTRPMARSRYGISFLENEIFATKKEATESLRKSLSAEE